MLVTIAQAHLGFDLYVVFLHLSIQCDFLLDIPITRADGAGAASLYGYVLDGGSVLSVRTSTQFTHERGQRVRSLVSLSLLSHVGVRVASVRPGPSVSRRLVTSKLMRHLVTPAAPPEFPRLRARAPPPFLLPPLPFRSRPADDAARPFVHH